MKPSTCPGDWGNVSVKTFRRFQILAIAMLRMRAASWDSLWWRLASLQTEELPCLIEPTIWRISERTSLFVRSIKLVRIRRSVFS